MRTARLVRFVRSGRTRRGFTLLEVMIALAVLAVAMLALLALDHEDLQSVIRAQDLSRAAMLAQALMTQVEIGPFPQVENSSGDFQRMYPRQYPNFRWRKVVAASGTFPDVRKVTITVLYGPHFGRHFDLVEFVHDPAFPEDQPQ
jgi:general secretion pathway protein I